MDNYLDLVNDSLKQSPFSLFDQVRVLVTRAHDLHKGKSCRIKELVDSKPTVSAHYELVNEAIEPVILEVEKKLPWISEDEEDEISY